MKRLIKMLVGIVTVGMLCGMLSGYAAVEQTTASVAVRERMPVYVDGKAVFTGYLVEDAVYVPLRSFCRSLHMKAETNWSADTGIITVAMRDAWGNSHTVTARTGDFYLYVNDRVVYLEKEILEYGGNMLVPLNGLCGAFGVEILGNHMDRGAALTTEGMEICAQGSAVYDAESLKWLSRIICAEAGNQSMKGQVCVGNVVLNRVKDSRFPDSVAGVVFAPGQFSPVANGMIYGEPDADAVTAAKLCLEGVNFAGDSTYFVNPVTGDTRWFRENLTFAMSVGDHDFYF